MKNNLITLRDAATWYFSVMEHWNANEQWKKHPEGFSDFMLSKYPTMTNMLRALNTITHEIDGYKLQLQCNVDYDKHRLRLFWRTMGNDINEDFNDITADLPSFRVPTNHVLLYPSKELVQPLIDHKVIAPIPSRIRSVQAGEGSLVFNINGYNHAWQHEVIWHDHWQEVLTENLKS